VARILAKSRRNNAQRQIVGALLFGDGCFLQCLEGQAQAVDALYGKIAADQRHRDVTVLLRSSITACSFGDWAMKYAPGDQALTGLLRSWGLSRFDPYALSHERLEAVVQCMQALPETASTLPGELDGLPPASVSAELRPSEPARGATAAVQAQPPVRRNRPPGWAVAAGLLMLAFGVVWWRR
jgi:hypothetical protein